MPACHDGADMRLKQRQSAELPGTVGVARCDRRTSALLPRLRRGDIAVIDHLDLDRTTAQRLADARVAAVVNTSAFLSGRHPARGAAVLLEAGVELVDGVPATEAARLREGTRVRLHEGQLFVDDEVVATGNDMTPERLERETAAARDAMPSQLATLTHNSTELLRREERLLLHREGLPRLTSDPRGGPVLVASAGPTLTQEMRGLRPWLRQQEVTIVAVGEAAQVLDRAGCTVDVLVLGSGDVDIVPAKLLRSATDVVWMGLPTEAELEALTRLGVTVEVFDTTIAHHEAGLVLAAAAEGAVVVSAGHHADVATLLDQQGSGPSALLGRLATGDRLVDARVLPQLWSGNLRSWHLWVVLVAGLLAVLAAVAVTPVGQDWWDQTGRDLFDPIRGLL